MQHKRRKGPNLPWGKLLLVLPVLVLVGGIVTLLTVDVPAPQKPVEQALDAKAFLEAKPGQ